MKVLIVTAHPHYAACYLGGTVANHVEKGDEVYVVSITKGEKVTNLYSEKEVMEINVKEMAAAAKVLGIKEVNYLDVEDTCIFQTDEIRLKITESIRRIKPDIIISHWKCDSHPDIRATAEMVEDCIFLAMLKQGKWAANFEPHFTKKHYAFDMPNYSRNFEPDYFVDIKKNLQKKKDATACLKLHLEVDTKGDLDKWLYTILKSNKRWGIEPGVEYAEAFRRIKIHEVFDPAVICLPE